jgi:hypothetical protein
VRAGDLLRRERANLRRFRSELDAAGREWRDQAQRSFTPPVPTDVAGVDFAAVQRWVADLFGPVAEPPLEPLGEDGPNWQEWDGNRLKNALRIRAEEDATPHRERFEEAREACTRLPDEVQRTALARLSQPLVPVACWVYDAHPWHVFQRWLVPTKAHQRWRAASLPGGEVSHPCDLPWPTTITVYRDLPLAALASSNLPATNANGVQAG